ncbi:uncharacterized protein ATNIH1004_009479 [Aspergillus tanneri]|uniref:NmrA-like domain-containing protein n=1 Tax=Aspergillus tanneri TaxID=1220188 RepID=A0A5M9MIP7_9EURO|nr:uncharacterized protein ATNIH1004_009479 [Aspergillus tanneri]KAA8642727.1 hypothetical protein ATNIH1004_009479 [Aspergillus tanneri]
MLQESYIEREAIVDACGNIGKHFTEQLLKAGKHTVTAITRLGSASSLLEAHTNIVKAASEAGVLYIMPNVYGSDIQNEELRKEDLYSD